MDRDVLTNNRPTDLESLIAEWEALPEPNPDDSMMFKHLMLRIVREDPGILSEVVWTFLHNRCGMQSAIQFSMLWMELLRDGRIVSHQKDGQLRWRLAV